MFKIVMFYGNRRCDMPFDKNLRLFEACYRANIYKRQNSKNIYQVVNSETGDIEYEV